MASQPIEQVMTIAYAALREEIGLRVPVSDQEYFRRIFYTERKKRKDPELDKLILFSPASVKEVFICKKEVEIDDELVKRAR